MVRGGEFCDVNWLFVRIEGTENSTRVNVKDLVQSRSVLRVGCSAMKKASILWSVLFKQDPGSPP